MHRVQFTLARLWRRAGLFWRGRNASRLNAAAFGRLARTLAVSSLLIKAAPGLVVHVIALPVPDESEMPSLHLLPAPCPSHALWPRSIISK